MTRNYQAQQLVFVDETGVSCQTGARTHGWSPCGERARRRDFFIRGVRYSVLPAMSLEGILHCDIQVGAYTAETFDHFVAGLLTKMNHFPQRNSVLVMDNASIHKSEQLVQMCEDR
jgi:hypothetical protein